MSRVAIIIPARFNASRFPGKVLADLKGKTVIERVYERAQKVKGVERIIIATDDERIQKECQRFGASVKMTRQDHVSGTDRIGEAAVNMKEDIIINWQGDEPLLDPSAVKRSLEMLLSDPKADIATVATSIKSVDELNDPNCVKVVIDENAYALYFSRSAIPNGVRMGEAFGGSDGLKHMGVYVYRKQTLLTLVQKPAVFIEKAEALEQLRALYYGFRIKVHVGRYESTGIDSPEDLDLVSRLL